MIRLLLGIYTWIILVDGIIDMFLPQYRNAQWAQTIKRLANYTLNPIRKVLPSDLPFDFSYLVVLLILQLIPALW